jgi:hypothetical protein
MTQQIELVLVRFSVSGVLGATQRNAETTAQVNEQHEAPEDAGEWRDKRFPASACGKVNPYTQWVNACAAVRTHHYGHTRLYEEGVAMLAAGHQAQYDLDMTRLKTVALEKFIAFCDWYETGKMLAKSKLNGGWREENYPALSKIQGRFAVDWRYSPYPTADHFVSGLCTASIDRARTELEQRNQVLLSEALTRTWKDVTEPLMKLAEVLASPDNVVRESLVTRVQDIAGRIPALNLTGDAQLTAAKAEIETMLQGVSAGALKDNQVLRLATAQKAVSAL